METRATTAVKKRAAVGDAGNAGMPATRSKDAAGIRLAKAGKRAHEVSGLDRIAMIRKGVPAAQLAELGRAMAVPRDRLFALLQLPRSTTERKIRDKERLSPEQSERVIGLERLVGQVQAMVEQAGNARGFDAARWVGAWLDRPLPALGGARPGELMDTIEGQQLVRRLLEQTQSGAYA